MSKWATCVITDVSCEGDLALNSPKLYGDFILVVTNCAFF